MTFQPSPDPLSRPQGTTHQADREQGHRGSAEDGQLDCSTELRQPPSHLGPPGGQGTEAQSGLLCTALPTPLDHVPPEGGQQFPGKGGCTQPHGG